MGAGSELACFGPVIVVALVWVLLDSVNCVNFTLLGVFVGLLQATCYCVSDDIDKV